MDWAAGVLREQQMPPVDIQALLTTTDAALVHRHLELHLERLHEWLRSQRDELETVEALLVEVARRRAASDPSPSLEP